MPTIRITRILYNFKPVPDLRNNIIYLGWTFNGSDLSQIEAEARNVGIYLSTSYEEVDRVGDKMNN